MLILATERLSEHKYKTPEGYLICTDAILARTGKQQYKNCEVFTDSEKPDEIIEINRSPDEVFSKATLASFENKPITVEHPDVDVNSRNWKDYQVGYVRDVRPGKTEIGEDVILGNLVIQDEDTIKEIENGQHTDLSCGYDCDIIDNEQKNIRGNHVALCECGRAGIARIIDSNDKRKEENNMILDWNWDFDSIVKFIYRQYYDGPIHSELNRAEQELGGFDNRSDAEKLATWIEEHLKTKTEVKRKNNSFVIKLHIIKDSIKDKQDKFLSEEAKKLKEDLNLYQHNSYKKEYNYNTGRKQNVRPWNSRVTEAMNNALDLIVKGTDIKEATFDLKRSISDFEELLIDAEEDDAKKLKLVISRAKKILDKLNNIKSFDTIKDDYDIEKYQTWVDYDMKKYGHISEETNEALKRANLIIVKDEYGDYEVIVKKSYDDALPGVDEKKFKEIINSEFPSLDVDKLTRKYNTNYKTIYQVLVYWYGQTKALNIINKYLDNIKDSLVKDSNKKIIKIIKLYKKIN